MYLRYRQEQKKTCTDENTELGAKENENEKEGEDVLKIYSNLFLFFTAHIRRHVCKSRKGGK